MGSSLSTSLFYFMSLTKALPVSIRQMIAVLPTPTSPRNAILQFISLLDNTATVTCNSSVSEDRNYDRGITIKKDLQESNISFTITI